MARPRTVSDEEILEATGRAVGRVGPAALTLADVAREAGIAPPTLIKRFGSKRELLLAFARRSGEGTRDLFAKARAGTEDPLEALETALLRQATSVRTGEAMANHLAFLQMEVADEEFRDHVVAHAEVLRDEITRLVKDAVARKDLPRDTDARVLARGVHLLYNGALVTWAMERRGILESAVREAIRFALRRESGKR
ncbi:MAG: hypothetical protein AMXMBFR53_27780 [Gemmatimonadota bacterium]